MATGGISYNNPIHTKFQDTDPFLTLPVAKKGAVARFVHTDKIVGRMGEFPELTKAVREGDIATVSILCAQLFDSNSAVKHPPQTHPIAA
jgi:hypothetical protein